MDVGQLLLWLGLMLLFLVINALFVAAEFALVAMRKSRIEELLADGHPQAPLLKRLKEQIDLSVSGMQLGITLASIALGWIGEHSILELVQHGLSLVGLTGVTPPAGTGIVLSFLILSILHVVIGEQVPKVIALRMPERVIMLLARIFAAYQTLVYPLVWFMNKLTLGCLRLLRMQASGHEDETVPSAEELEILIDQSHDAGELDARDRELLKRVFDMRDMPVSNVMIPRTRTDCIAEGSTVADAMKAVSKTKHSKLPVYTGTVEKIVGILHAKDLIDIACDQPKAKIKPFIRPVHVVKTTDMARQVLDDMRQKRIQMVVVSNEAGKLLGLVTMEDLLERLVGDIYDEYDKHPH